MTPAIYIKWVPCWPGCTLGAERVHYSTWYLVWLAFFGVLVLNMSQPRAAEFTCDQAKFWLGHFSAEALEKRAASLGIVITAADRAKAANCMRPTTQTAADVPAVARTRGGAAAARSVHTRKVEGASPSPASFHKHAPPEPVAPPADRGAENGNGPRLLPSVIVEPVAAAHEPEIKSATLDVTRPEVLPPPVVVQAPVFEPPAPRAREKKMLTAEHLLVLFALVGAGTFTYLVYTKGLVPAVQKITTWWNTAKTDVATLEARLVTLENRVKTLASVVSNALPFPQNTGPVLATAPAQAAPSPAAPTGASPAAAAPLPPKVA